LLLVVGYQLDVLDKDQSPHMQGEALRGQTHTWLLDVSYGATSWLTGSLVVPFAYKTQDVLSETGSRNRSVFGLADPMLIGKLTIWGHDELNPAALRIGILAGLKVPFGSHDESEGGKRLPATFQIGTGIFDLIGGIYGSMGPFAKSTLFGSFVARIPTDRNDRGYQFGPTVTMTSGLRAAHLFPVTVSAGIRASGGARDRDGPDVVDESGGWQIASQLGVAYSPWDSVFFNLDAIMPAWHNLHGNQMYSQVSVLLGANASF